MLHQDKRRGRPKVRRAKAAAYREINHLKIKLAAAERLAEKYKKRHSRILGGKKMMSPSSKTASMLKSNHVTSGVRRTLLFHNVLIEEMRSRYKRTSSEKQRQIVSKYFTGQIIKKYRLLTFARKALALSQRRLVVRDGNTAMKYIRQRRQTAIDNQMKATVANFLQRDDNSRTLPGKKDTVTYKLVKKQKSLLSDTMQNLHLKFCTESQIQISYSTFCRLKPFWIVKPTLRDRQTCACKIHENIDFMVERLFKQGLVTSRNPEQLVEDICCDIDDAKCMYRDCNGCKEKLVPIVMQDPEDAQQRIWWWEWKRQRETRIKDEKLNPEEIQVQVTSQVRTEGTVEELCTKFQKDIARFASHIFTIRHQYRCIRELRSNMSEDDIFLHVDFSENYVCKYGKEIQSVHFGASHNQVTLHTGIAYTDDAVKPFCSISKSTRHDERAVWAHLQPVLQHLLSKKPTATTLHMLTDGPTTQYKNKVNFYLASTEPIKMGFRKVIWNFLETSHGKGAADGIGGVLKRTADRLIATGIDIPDAGTLIKVLKPQTSVMLFEVACEDITKVDSIVKDMKIRQVPGTLKIHQLFTDRPGILSHRKISCYCAKPYFCQCYAHATVQLVSEVATTGPPGLQEATAVGPPHLQEATAAGPPGLQEVTVTEPLGVLEATAAESLRVQEATAARPPGIQATAAESLGVREVTATLEATASQQHTPQSCLNPVIETDESLIGKWCVVSYDQKPYPGIIENVDEDEIEVKVMHNIGPNRYFWPRMDDILWYDLLHVVSLIPEPQYVTKRHVAIERRLWEKIEMELY